MNRGSLSKFKRLQEQASAFFHERGIERTHHSQQSVGYRFAHFWLLVIKSFIRNRCPVRASALAYTTLLALVPLLAVGISISTGLVQKSLAGKEGEKPIDDLIESLVKNVAPALDLQSADATGGNNRVEVAKKIADYIKNIQSGTLGVTSTIALVFVAIGLLRTIEAAFNDIWGVTSGRGWIASVIQYWATITLGPVILIVVLGLTTGPQFQRVIGIFASSKFASDDIKDFPSLASKLTRKADPFSEYLYGRLTPALQAELVIAATNGVPARGSRHTLADALNDILEGPSLYDAKRFSTITLLPAIRTQIDSAPTGQALVRLNRSLLDAAYPHELATKQPAFFEGVFFQILPFIVLSLAFGTFYQLMPNTPVQWQAALVGGIVGGSLWQLNNKLHVLYASKVVTYSKIYGSLSIIPLFLIGMYFSWLILLFGAQVAYAYQNRRAYLEEKQADCVHQKGREFVALRVMTRIARAFSQADHPPTVPQLAELLGVPTKLVAQILGVLLKARLVVEVTNHETGYSPARPLESITAHDILQAMRVGTGQELEARDDGLLGRVRGEFDRIGDVEQQTASSITLAALVQRLPL